MSLYEFWDHLRLSIGKGGIKTGALREEELKEVQELRDSKYATWEWNFGKSPAYDKKNRKHFDGGSVEVRLTVERGGTIGDVIFYGDFLSKRPLDEITGALHGCRNGAGG